MLTPWNYGRRTANGVVPLQAMQEEVYRLTAFCRDRGNCYGILQVCAWHEGLGWPLQP